MSKSKYQYTWKGEKNRSIQVVRPCPCGCDERDGFRGVGYITGSDKDGNGFTIYIRSEEVFQVASKLINNNL